MKIEKIYFEQLFPTGQYANQRLGVEISFESTDCKEYNADPSVLVNAAYISAKEMVDNAFKALNPELQPIETVSPSPSQPIPENNIATERILIAIENSTTIPELEKHFPDALKYGLQEEYNKRLEELGSCLSG